MSFHFVVFPWELPCSNSFLHTIIGVQDVRQWVLAAMSLTQKPLGQIADSEWRLLNKLYHPSLLNSSVGWMPRKEVIRTSGQRVSRERLKKYWRLKTINGLRVGLLREAPKLIRLPRCLSGLALMLEWAAELRSTTESVAVRLEVTALSCVLC